MKKTLKTGRGGALRSPLLQGLACGGLAMLLLISTLALAAHKSALSLENVQGIAKLAYGLSSLLCCYLTARAAKSKRFLWTAGAGCCLLLLTLGCAMGTGLKQPAWTWALLLSGASILMGALLGAGARKNSCL